MTVEERLTRVRSELAHKVALTETDPRPVKYPLWLDREDLQDLLHLVDLALDQRPPLDEGQAVRSGDGIRIYEEHAWEQK